MNGSKTWVEISRGALTRNLRALKKITGGTAAMAVVKSNAYGHGLLPVTKIAETAGAEWFGVDNVDEGLTLRRAGIRKPILVLGYTLKERLRDCAKHGLSFVAYDKETLDAIGRAGTRYAVPGTRDKYKIHIKIETGTTRQGVALEDLKNLIKKLKSNRHAILEGASTHYANIEDTTDYSYAENQLSKFKQALSVMSSSGLEPAWKHSACSAAAILFPETHFNLVRFGISLYGMWSSKETQAVARRHRKGLELEPALTWKTVVAQVKAVKKGTPVSYGLTERVTRDSRIAVMPVGYWDGYDRGLSSSGTVLIRGQRCKILGRICMNMCMADVTDLRSVKPEDEAVLLGRQRNECVSAEEIASKTGTINYEVVTRINPLIKRIVVT